MTLSAFSSCLIPNFFLLVMNFCFRIFVVIVWGYRVCERCLPFCFVFYFVDDFFPVSFSFFFGIGTFFWMGFADISGFGNFFRVILMAKLNAAVWVIRVRFCMQCLPFLYLWFTEIWLFFYDNRCMFASHWGKLVLFMFLDSKLLDSDV